MKKEVRTIVYDDDLHMEAYRLEGIVQPFPNHFHEYYVIGLIENGERYLSCKGNEYRLKKGNMVLFHPSDNHACAHCGEHPLDYRGLNIPTETMRNLTQEIIGERKLPGFSKNVINNNEANYYLQLLHQMIMEGSDEFGKEENLFLLLSTLIQNYEKQFADNVPKCRNEIASACTFMEQNYVEKLSLEQICKFVGLSKSTLLRAFVKEKGVTPYRYLETTRINKAKKLLEQGITPMEAAMQTGFSDQSHFTNYFNSFIGLTPSMYRDIFLDKNLSGGKTSVE